MDDGFEGYMSAHRTRDGRPVCHRSEICGVIPSDQLFQTDKHYINANGRAQLTNFFQTANAFGFLIYGHTDARASDEYNIALSNRRANAVSEVARAAGARVVDVKGFGERHRARLVILPQHCSRTAVLKFTVCAREQTI